MVACALQLLGLDFCMRKMELGIDSRKTRRKSRRKSAADQAREFTEGEEWEEVEDKEKETVYILGKLGNMHAARFFSRHLYCLHLLVHEGILKEYAKEKKNDKDLLEIIKLLSSKDTKAKLILCCSCSCHTFFFFFIVFYF